MQTSAISENLLRSFCKKPHAKIDVWLFGQEEIKEHIDTGSGDENKNSYSYKGRITVWATSPNSTKLKIY